MYSDALRASYGPESGRGSHCLSRFPLCTRCPLVGRGLDYAPCKG
jgi:hypothetical protein